MDEALTRSEGVVGSTVQLPPSQWEWLRQRSRRSQSRKVSIELRQLVAAEMHRERAERGELVA